MTKIEEKIFNYAKSVDFNVALTGKYLNFTKNVPYNDYVKLEGDSVRSKAEHIIKKYNSDFYNNLERN